jgi:POT family proton-dependent oligopeptide transporter
MPTSLNFFAIHHVRASILGVHINPQSFQVFNPLWMRLLSPILASWYRKHRNSANGMSIAHKFALGMTLCGISFMTLYFPQFFADEHNQVSSLWLVLSYFFQSFGELFISALGVAMVAELVPPAINGFIMGMWFLTSASAGFIGAFVASFTKVPSGLTVGYETLHLYSSVFLKIGIITCLLAFLMWGIAPRLSAIIKCNRID